MPGAHQGAPGAEEGALVEEGGLGDLRQGVHRVLGVHVAQQHAQAVRALQLLDAPVDVLRLQQVVPARAEGQDSAPLIIYQRILAAVLWTQEREYSLKCMRSLTAS